MVREKVLLKSESPKSLTEISSFLRDLADKVESGKLSLKQAEDELSFELPQNCVLEIKVEEKPKGEAKKYQLEVEIEWVEGNQKQEVELI